MPIRYTSRVGSFLDAFRARTRAAIAGLAPEGERIAKMYCPVDTGFLQSTITCTPITIGLGLQWQATASYAGYVHNGTPTMAPRPFLTIAALEIEPQLQEAIGRGSSTTST